MKLMWWQRETVAEQIRYASGSWPQPDGQGWTVSPPPPRKPQTACLRMVRRRHQYLARDLAWLYVGALGVDQPPRLQLVEGAIEVKRLVASLHRPHAPRHEHQQHDEDDAASGPRRDQSRLGGGGGGGCC